MTQIKHSRPVAAAIDAAMKHVPLGDDVLPLLDREQVEELVLAALVAHANETAAVLQEAFDDATAAPDVPTIPSRMQAFDMPPDGRWISLVYGDGSSHVFCHTWAAPEETAKQVGIRTVERLARAHRSTFYLEWASEYVEEAPDEERMAGFTPASALHRADP